MSVYTQITATYGLNQDRQDDVNLGVIGSNAGGMVDARASLPVHLRLYAPVRPIGKPCLAGKLWMTGKSRNPGATPSLTPTARHAQLAQHALLAAPASLFAASSFAAGSPEAAMALSERERSAGETPHRRPCPRWQYASISCSSSASSGSAS